MKSLVLVLVLVACGDRTETKPTPSPPPVPVVTPSAPVVDAEFAIAAIHKLPPVLVIVDETGAIQIAAVDQWDDLKKPIAQGRPIANRALLERFLELTFQTGKTTRQIVAAFDPNDPRLATPPDAAVPEEEVLTEEGNMTTLLLGGNPRTNDPLEGERQRRKMELREQRSISGVPGPQLLVVDLPDARYAQRLAKHAGEVILDRMLPPQQALVIAPAKLAASKLVEIVSATSGGIAVVHAGELRVLRVSFMKDPEAGRVSAEQWIEARLSSRGVAIEAVPDVGVEVAWSSGPLAREQLADAIKKARAPRNLDIRVPVDILVEPDVDAQRLVDLIVALDAAGAVTIGLGDPPSADEAAKRGKRMRTVTIGIPTTYGSPLDASVIRAHVTKHHAKLHECYDTAIKKQPTLAGVIALQYLITPSGSAAGVTGHGIDDKRLVKCFIKAVERIEFPKVPGMGVQVSQTITLRQ